MTEKKKIKVVLPVYNEEKELEENTLKLRDFLINNLSSYDFEIQIADNASIDGTARVGQKLENRYGEISFLRLEQKGRGRAIKKSWSVKNADIYIYMDIDLSTDLKHLPVLVKAINEGFDISIGTRLKNKSRVVDRTLKREFISRTYNFLIKIPR